MCLVFIVFDFYKDRRLKFDSVTKIMKVRAQKVIFFVEWLLFAGENEVWRIENDLREETIIHLMVEVVNAGFRRLL